MHTFLTLSLIHIINTFKSTTQIYFKTKAGSYDDFFHLFHFRKIFGLFISSFFCILPKIFNRAAPTGQTITTTKNFLFPYLLRKRF